MTGHTTRLLRSGALSLSAALVMTTAPAVAAPTPGSSGLGDSYYPADGNGGYDVRHYGIHNRMLLAQQRVVGTTTVTAVATKDLSRFNLDFLLGVKSVRVNGRPARFTKTNRHELRITPRTPLTEGSRFTVRVAYAGRPAGIGWAGERAWLGNRKEVVAMGEPHVAALWFPANDHPRDKARFDIRITVRKGLQGVANGRLVSARRSAQATTWHWRAAEPMSTYLAFFAAGSFRFQRGRTTGGLPWINAVSRQLHPAQQKRAFEFLRTTPKVLRRLESWLGDYPFSTTGGLVTSLDTGFALENQTRPTYPNVGGAGQKGLVAHELAHQWLGDLVAVKGWKDIWVNEGLASYMELLEDGWGFQRPEVWLRASWDPDAVDWGVRIADPGRPDLFNWAVYVRGAMAVQALRNRIGTPALKKLLRAWVTGRSHGSVAEFERLAKAVSGEDLDGFFDAWLHARRMPAKTAANGWR